MKLVDLMPAEGAVQTGRRKGRGPGSGLGKTSGKGHKIIVSHAGLYLLKDSRIAGKSPK